MAVWVKKQSGHPSGRRLRGKIASDLIRRIGGEQVTFEDDGEVLTMSRRERMFRVLWTKAAKGDLAAARLVLAYSDGRPVQQVKTQVETTIRITADDLAKAMADLAATGLLPPGR